MPYTQMRLTNEEAQKKAAETGFISPNMLEQSSRVRVLELVCSSFSDPGPDWSEWVAYDDHGQVIGRRHMNGY